jgi:hypothetical protein
MRTIAVTALAILALTVRQTPPPGRRVRPETVVTLFSKKIGE